MLGLNYRDGRGVPQDDAEAVAWLRRAAEQGTDLARVTLAEMYAEGRGVPLEELEQLRRDIAEAVQRLTELSNVQAIRIEDDWTGFGSIASLKAHYTLKRQSDVFEGTGTFSVGSCIGGLSKQASGLRCHGGRAWAPLWKQSSRKYQVFH